MKRKLLKILLIIILMVVILFELTACGKKDEENEDTSSSKVKSSLSKKDDDTDEKTEDEEQVKLNSELNDVVSYALGADYKTVYAINKDGSSIELTTASRNYYNIDYYSGKIYLAGDVISTIDLTQGNGNYTCEDFKINSLPKGMNIGVMDGKIYTDFTPDMTNIKNNQQLISIDIGTKEVHSIVKGFGPNLIEFLVDKKNNKIYYSSQDEQGNYSLNEFDVKSQKTTQIDTNPGYQYLGKNYSKKIYLNIISEKYLIYSKQTENSTDYFIYNREANDITPMNLEASSMIGDIVGDKIFFAESDGQMGYPEYRLSVYENGNIRNLEDYQENDYSYINNLGTGKIDALMTWGQDISSNGSQNYLIDVDTEKIEKSDDISFGKVHIIDPAENVKYNEKERDDSKDISAKEAEKIINEKWGMDGNNSDSNNPDEIKIGGGYTNYKMYDTDGNEYYVFAYYSLLEDHNSFVTAYCISVDGKKYYRMDAGSEINENGIIQGYDEKGDLL